MITGAIVTHYCGAQGTVWDIITPPMRSVVELKKGYARVHVKVIKAKGPYREGDNVIWDVPDLPAPVQ